MLELININKSYTIGGSTFFRKQTMKVADDICLTLEQGMCLGLVGESGSGKSTLGKMILGLEQPDGGEIWFEGKNLLTLNKKERLRMRRHIQTVFQDCYSSLNPRWPVYESIREPLANFEKLSASEEKRTIQELLVAVGLKPEDMTQFPHQFSGGQLQRISIARAIALRPRLVVLDEAVSSLDVLIQHQILQLLMELKQQFKLSYLFISHDIMAVRSISDPLAVMSNGRIVETLSVKEPLSSMKHPASRQLVASILPSHPRDRHASKLVSSSAG
ncbi:ATP-binding cassette domain-containing protein [Paenibacillus allorhizosphaerae]|uniref:ABC transporter ATP-binding protein n=1 Tax=Paenibacillus allorhizosphaerae TaxID=2849866 RepID=A0ABM8VLY9_9BACL|nr:dipeptide/oligopeptide/nickel ABC transporter ATP-binding protein [Paenibacillus allorhizosphaerae]CAG7649186.1 putative ABC transporter ATP-binding protein [Paenibacillus allorhizosphaerae]